MATISFDIELDSPNVPTVIHLGPSGDVWQEEMVLLSQALLDKTGLPGVAVDSNLKIIL